MVRDAIHNFRRIQGAEAGESLQGALTVEVTQESAKVINARRVARFFAKKYVATTRRDHCGYTPCGRAFFLAKIRSNVTYHNFTTTCLKKSF